MVWCIEYWWAKNFAARFQLVESARFELVEKDPIWFLVRSLNHSAMTSRRKYFYLYRSRYVCLTAVWAFTFSRCYVKTIFESFSSVDEMSCVNRNYPNSAKFELELDGPMWFLFTRPCTPQRLQFRISNFIGVRHCFLSCPYTFFSISRIYLFFTVSDSLMVWYIEFWRIEYWWATNYAVSKIRTCAARPDLISSQTP